MDLFEKVSEDIKNAMKAKDKVALETLRNVKKCFLEARTAPGANDTLTDADALKIMQKLVKQGRDSAEIYKQQGREDLAQMSAEELEAELRKIVAEVGASSPKDMGKVMGVASKALAGRAEGRMISEAVKRLLNN